MSRRFFSICALVLCSLAAPVARVAQAQDATVTVTILRRTPVRANPSAVATTIGLLNPSTIGVTQIKLEDGYVRIPLRQIDRRWPARGYGFIDAADVDVDSGATRPVARTRPDSAVRARSAQVGAAPGRTDTPAPGLPSAAVPVDSPDLSFLKTGPLTAIVQRPISLPIGTTGDTITVPAGYVAEFSSIPRSLWTELSPTGEHARVAIVHDYLYWFQPCEREEADNLLMSAMKQAGISDLKRGAVYGGVRIGSADAWNANAAARDRGDLKIVPPQIRPTPQESWSAFRTRLGRADIRGTPGRMPRQKYCDYGKSQQAR
jgi:hypothetical protein